MRSFLPKIGSFSILMVLFKKIRKSSYWRSGTGWHRYIPKEENHSADYIANLAFGREEDLHLFESPPDEVLDFRKSDKERIFVPPEYPM
ncbi:hypothetical protein PVK06_030802 [Gossypium arboreum]|uniref:Uncharacterized protein n=1 Tax=Gossypium arboreum TaxID=29729 RepID=A0ABR0NPB4_GOSAR|nr:hypothetical protein PVK06_030802 [Gossypium arboreum]